MMIRSIAKETILAQPTIHRIWQVLGLQPHFHRYFKISPFPFIVEKVRDIVGLYLNPPNKTMMLYVDEKSQIQSLDREPLLPIGLGYVVRVTHDYIRHGTTTLFSALDIAIGKIPTCCKKRHHPREYLQFLKQVDASIPADVHIHQIEIWFNLITQRASRHRTFKSVKDLIANMGAFVTHYKNLVHLPGLPQMS